MRRVYLDHSSGTYLMPEVLETFRAAQSTFLAQPTSMHSCGIQVLKAIEAAEISLMEMLGTESDGRLHFLPDGYMLCRIAVQSLAKSLSRRGRHIVCSSIEQPGVLDSVRRLEREGFTYSQVEPDRLGRLNPQSIESAIQKDTCLVISHYVHPDLGTIQPIEQIGVVAKKYDTAYYVDLDGSVGYLPLDLDELRVDAATCSANRFHGPKNSGLLFCRRGLSVEKALLEDWGLGPSKASCLDSAAIISMAKAGEIALERWNENRMHGMALQKRFLDHVHSSIPYKVLNGPPPGERRAPNHIGLSIEFIEGEALMLAMDMKGIAIHAGAACLSRAMKVPKALTEIGQNPRLAKGSVLLTLSPKNTLEEMDHTAVELCSQVEKLRSMSLAWEQFETGQLTALSPKYFPTG